MLQKSCPKGQVEQHDVSQVSTPDSQPTDSTPKASRRALFSLMTASIASCSTESKFFGGKNQAPPKIEDLAKEEPEIEPDQGPAAAPAEPELEVLTEGRELTPCDPYSIYSKEVLELPELSSEPTLVPELKFYGTEGSNYLAVDFDKYNPAQSNNPIKLIRLVRGDGRNIAFRLITAADIQSTERLWPIGFENVQIKRDQDVFLVVTSVDDSSLKYTIRPADMQSVKEFRDLPVVSIAANGAVDANYAANQAIADFELRVPITKGAATVGMDLNNVRYNDDPTKIFDNRPLKTVLNGVEFRPSGASRFPADTIVTDIMGNEIGTGASFSDIVSYPTFIGYRLGADQNGNQVYFRSFITIG